MSLRYLCGDALEQLRTLPVGSVHMCCTSPPYWGLRDYGVVGQMGLEPIMDCLGWATGVACGECYVCHMVQVFTEVRRVLRPDGVCFMNLGDSYAGSLKGIGANGKAYAGQKQRTNAGSVGIFASRPPSAASIGLKAKDLCMVPARVALALQADGWWLRSEIIWHKPSCLPESVQDRPTRAHEQMFLLTKSARYFFDAEAVREQASDWGNSPKFSQQYNGDELKQQGQSPHHGLQERHFSEKGRNVRTVWSIPAQPFADAHFATFPPALVERCILAGTSAHGVCGQCGTPWKRVVEREKHGYRANGQRAAAEVRHVSQTSALRGNGRDAWTTSQTTGWHQACACPTTAIARAVVLDPFMGSGTTLLVADRLGRDGIGIELNPAYIQLSKERLCKDASLFHQGVTA